LSKIGAINCTHKCRSNASSYAEEISFAPQSGAFQDQRSLLPENAEWAKVEP
jgi:hypothetical protein